MLIVSDAEALGGKVIDLLTQVLLTSTRADEVALDLLEAFEEADRLVLRILQICRTLAFFGRRRGSRHASGFQRKIGFRVRKWLQE
jgi:hypothetical protein